MKHYFTPECEVLTVQGTDVIVTSLNVADAYNWEKDNDWDWSV